MAESVDVDVRRQSGVGIVDVRGYVNNVLGERVAASCSDLIDEGLARLLLNMEGCTMVNSVGISFLIDVIERVNELQGQVAFCCVGSTTAKTFQIMGLLQTASVYDTERDAMEALGV